MCRLHGFRTCTKKQTKKKQQRKKEKELICTKCAGFEGKRRIHKYKVTLALLDFIS